MIKPLSIRLQLILMIALTSFGITLWIAREQLSNALTVLTKSVAAKKVKRGGGRSVPIIVHPVRLARNDELISAVGTTRARRSVMIHAKTNGVIIAFNPQAGDHVRAGTTIFQLDGTRAELAVKIAAKKLEEASRLLERSKLLMRRNVNSSARVVDAKVVAERAALQLQQTQENLKDLKILAPFDGVIGFPKAEVGDRVTAATPVVSLDMRTELLVEFEVPEKYSARIVVGDTVEAVTPGFEHKRFSGRIERIDSRIDPVSRTVKLRAVIPNQKDLLRPGMSFGVEIMLPGATFTAVPELSLQWRKGESYVWIVRGKKVVKILVKTIKRLNSIVLVDGKVAPDDLVVVEGVQRLRPGRAVSYTLPSRPLDKRPGTPRSSADQPKRSPKTDLRSKG